MALFPQSVPPIPADTARVAHAAFPKGTLAIRARDALGSIYTDEAFADLFPPNGQPALSPWRLALVLVLRLVEGLSDRQAADAVRGRIDWKYALSLELTDPGFDFSVLSAFRDRLLKDDGAERILDPLLPCLRDQHLLKARGTHRTTTTIVNYQNGVLDGDPNDQDLITQVVYDAAGRQVETRDPAGRVTRMEYDLTNKLTCVIENAQPGVDCAAAVLDTSLDSNVATRYQYDRAGNRIAIIDARGHQRSFGYDAANRQTTETGALGYTTAYQYDRLGRKTFKDDPRGATHDVTYTYDALSRSEGITATTLTAPITMDYDALGRRTSLNDATGTTSFVPDALGRITQVTAPDSGTIGYQYNRRGQRTQISYPDGSTVLDYQYYADGQMEQVMQGVETLASYTYNTAGRLETTTLANGAVTTHLYDAVGRIDTQTTEVSSSPVLAFDYDTNRAGQRTQVVETISGLARTTSYGYDGLNRLTSADDSLGNSFTYAYDRTGNRTSTTTNGAQTANLGYNAANQVQGWSYDEAGNLLSYGHGTAFSYDALNRLTSANNGASRYTYNGDGVLVAATEGAATTRYTQDLAAPLSQILSDGTDTYLYGQQRLASVNGSERTWELHDALGSVRTH